jgi:hypothetical protein
MAGSRQSRTRSRALAGTLLFELVAFPSSQATMVPGWLRFLWRQKTQSPPLMTNIINRSVGRGQYQVVFIDRVSKPGEDDEVFASLPSWLESGSIRRLSFSRPMIAPALTTTRASEDAAPKEIGSRT